MSSHLAKLMILGVDVGYRTCGWFAARPSKRGLIRLGHGVIDGGSTKGWDNGSLKKVLWLLSEKCPNPDLVGVEEIVWIGKRKGALALAHLAGAIAGYYLGQGASVAFYLPRNVKARSADTRAKFPTDHERDAYVLAQMAYEGYLAG